MTTVTKNGTKMWCSKCCQETYCKVIPVLSMNPLQAGQRKRSGETECEEVHWFHRRRKCLVCGDEFDTAEVKWELVVELVKLRELTRNIKRDVDKLIKWQSPTELKS